MSRLLEVYDELVKEAEFSKVAEEVELMFSKYAETATEMLTQEYGADFDSNDVSSLAEGLMERDADMLEQTEKVAEYENIGRELAHQYMEELQKEAAMKDTMNKVKKSGKKAAKGAGEAFSKMVGTVKKNPLLFGGTLAAGAAGGALLAGNN